MRIMPRKKPQLWPSKKRQEPLVHQFAFLTYPVMFFWYAGQDLYHYGKPLGRAAGRAIGFGKKLPKKSGKARGKSQGRKAARPRDDTGRFAPAIGRGRESITIKERVLNPSWSSRPRISRDVTIKQEGVVIRRAAGAR